MSSNKKSLGVPAKKRSGFARGSSPKKATPSGRSNPYRKMSTAYVDPEVPKWWGRSCVVHAQQRVAWIDVLIVGLSWKTQLTQGRVEVVQAFIDAQGWKGRAINSYHSDCFGKKWEANGLLELSGGNVSIVWEWQQVLSWLQGGWPTKNVRGVEASVVGTWCYREGVDPRADHISRCPFSGWKKAEEQMRRMGIPSDVRSLKRRITEHEVIDALCGALKKHRVKLEKQFA